MKNINHNSKKTICVILLACSVLLNGCRQRSHPSKACHMIKVQNIEVTEKTLTLDYQVSNPFKYDIWVCEDIDTRRKYDVETRIDVEMVWIKLLSNLETNISLEIGTLAKYRRLFPGESHSEKIILNLPIRNASPVYNFHEDHKKHKQVVLHRAVFEVGYFEGKLINTISDDLEKFKRGRPAEELKNTQFEPLVKEEIEDGQSRKFLYFTNIWLGISKEKSAKVIITDVNIPCSVVVDDQ